VVRPCDDVKGTKELGFQCIWKDEPHAQTGGRKSETLPYSILRCRIGAALQPLQIYDAQAGRYVNQDPIGLLGGTNGYSYAENRPLTAIDPLGLVALAAPALEAVAVLAVRAIVTAAARRATVAGVAAAVSQVPISQR
jgi:hypothetical protein